MSDPQSALNGASFKGLVTVQEAGLHGMISLRADLGSAALAKAIKKLFALAIPEPRQVVSKGDNAVAWMSPDELLILTPYEKAAGMADALTNALAGEHHLVADVSDARALFTLSGASVREVLAKLTPADLSPGAFPQGEIRRSRLAQVAAAFWLNEPDEITLICFRSVADYAFALLKNAAKPGSEVGFT